MKTAISFGLVHIPISLHTATMDNSIHFNQLLRGTTNRIRYKKVADGSDSEVKASDIVRGYEYEPGKYVVVTDDEFERIKTEKERTIQILHFTSLEQISTIQLEKAYHAIPELGGEKAFELLRRAMSDERRVAIARTVLGTKDTLLALIPQEDGLMAQTMFYTEELKESPQGYAQPKVNDAELVMAKQLIAGMDKPFDPTQYRDEYQVRVRELIAAKIEGAEISLPKADKQETVIDLMEALRLSIEQKEPIPAPRKRLLELQRSE